MLYPFLFVIAIIVIPIAIVFLGPTASHEEIEGIMNTSRALDPYPSKKCDCKKHTSYGAGPG